MFGLPILTYGLAIIMLLLVIRNDTPKYYIAHGDLEAAKNSVHKIYKTGDSNIIASKIVRFIKKSGEKTTSTATVKDSLFKDDRYIRASWVNIGLMVCHVFTGYQFVLSFSSSIFEEILADPNTITPE